MSDLKKLITFFTPAQKKQSIVLLFLMFLGVCTEIIGVSLVLPVVSIIINPDLLNEYLHFLPGFEEATYMGNNSKHALWALLLLLLAYILKGLFLTSISWFQTSFAFGIQSNLSSKLFSLYLSKGLNYHTNTNSSKLVRNIVGEVSTLVSNFILPMGTVIIETMVLAGMAILLLVIEPIGSLLAITFLIIAGLSFNYITKTSLRRWGKTLQSSEKERILHIQQTFGCFKEIKLLNRENYFMEKYEESNLKSAESLRKNTFMQAIPRVLIEIIAIVGVVILTISILGSDAVGVMPLLALFGAAAFRVMPSFTRLINAIQYIQNSKVILDNIYGELHLDVVSDNHNAVDPFVFEQCLEVNNLEFKHSKENIFFLSGVSFKINKGQCIGLVGPSGSGKSTVVDLISGLIQPSRGEVLVDGINILENIKGWQGNIGYIPQSIYLLDDTIRKNVALGVPEEEICDKRVWDALEKANLKNFILGQTKKLETLAGEYGARLSGGQRQRIGIARALYNNPEFLILDEATSALDSDTEKNILETIAEILNDKTVLIITHKVETLTFCDNIIKIDGGKIV